MMSLRVPSRGAARSFILSQVSGYPPMVGMSPAPCESDFINIVLHLLLTP